MVPGLLAPVTSTCVPTGSVPLVHPSVAVLPPVPEQWAACPMYVLVPSLKMKLDVHWAPLVKVWTPGRTAADDAGAHAEAIAGASSTAATTPIEHASATSFLTVASSVGRCEIRLQRVAAAPCLGGEKICRS